MSLQDEFAKDLTASRPDADILWLASNDISAAFRIAPDGSLTKTGAVAIPGGAGAEGIVAP